MPAIILNHGASALDTPDGNFAGFNIREADLARHLEDKNSAATPAANGSSAALNPNAAQATDKDKEKDKDKAGTVNQQRRYEFGSADDFQLKQAMNHLKGLPVETAKTRESVAATNTPTK